MTRLTATQQKALSTLICDMDDCPGIYFGAYKYPHCSNQGVVGEQCVACVQEAVAALSTDQELPCAD